MRLRKFEIHNFKGIQSASFEWEDILVLIGENNVGKSSVLEALQWFLSGSQIKDESLFHDHVSDSEHAIELVGYFDQLTPEEQSSVAVQGRMSGGEWIIKKRFWTEAENPGGEEKSWKERYYSFSGSEVFTDWPNPDTSWPAFPADYQPFIVQIGATRPNQQNRDQLRELVRQNRPDMVSLGSAEWIENPGGGGGWKSNVNSVIPRFIIVKAVHDAASEASSKEASAYGKIVSLIVENRMMQRPEVAQLRVDLDAVLTLFRPDPEHPERQAEEIRDVQERINARLNEVIGGVVSIKTIEPDIRPVLLPSTTLVLQDREDGVKTSISNQGHGLQRTLIMTLLQILAEIQGEANTSSTGPAAITRSVVLAVEEPELYMHPQMERKMRDVLYRLASQPGLQVICTTHSPVFIDVAHKHNAIVRIAKDSARVVSFLQVTADLFSGSTAADERARLQVISRFNASVNEVFFAKRVVLLEEQSAIAAFDRAAELSGLFTRHPNVRRDITLIDAQGRGNIPLYQKVLNHFQVPYTVIHDEDSGNPRAATENARIVALLSNPINSYLIRPTNLEGLLSYTTSGDKTYQAFRRVEELHSTTGLPPVFVSAMNFVYFGHENEPA